MKFKTLCSVILLINMLVLVWLQNETLKEIEVAQIITDTYEKDANNGEKLSSQSVEVQAVDNNLVGAKDTVDMEKESKDNKTQNNPKYKMTDDNKKIGIVITNNNDNIFHKKIVLKTSGIITIYYGKHYENIKTFSKEITIDGKEFFNKSNRIKITSDKKIILQGLTKAAFEGSFCIYKEKQGFVPVNVLEINRYLYGVVGSEMPSSFEIEALKAQAVCARTYTYAHIKNKKYEKYKAIMDDTVSYQAYGNEKATKKVKQAVNETKGLVLTDNFKLINAYYFSTSCGYTTDYRIWGDKEYKYLNSRYVSNNDDVTDVSTKDYFNKFIKSIPDSYENKCAFYRWEVIMSDSTIKEKIQEMKGIHIENIKDIKVEQRGAGGIVSKLKIVGKKDDVIITNQNEIRKVFSPNGYKLKLNDNSDRTNMASLPSAFFVIDKINETEYKLTGGGFGHGSGMSQYGAHEMAKEGKNCSQILNFFYTGVTCDQKYIQ